MLESALYLNQAVAERDVSRGEVRRRKKQIADKYGNEAYAVASLCSAGYFDEDRLFQNLYHELDASGADTEYEEAFVTLATNKPFVVFVQTEDTPREVHDTVLMKSLRRKDYDVDISFIDVRGINPSNHRTIEEAVAMLENDYEGLSYERRSSDHEMVVRIDTESF